MDESTQPTGIAAGQALLIEGGRGAERDAAVGRWTRRLQAEAPTDVTVLRCDFDEGGPWAGLRELLRALVPAVRTHAPELVTQHDYELALIVPDLRRTIRVRNPSLTDTAIGDEAVRNYAVDRAYRIVHGAVNLLASWRERCAPGRAWLLVCEDLDRGGALVRQAMGELLRRKGRALDVRLIATVASDGIERLGDELATRVAFTVPVAGADPAPLSSEPPDPVRARAAAEALQAQIERDPIALEERLAELIAAWQRSDTPERARRWCAWGLGSCNHNGMYEDALRYGEQVIDHLDLVAEGSEEVRWNLIGNLFHALVATGAPERALRLVEREALGRLQTPVLRLKACYVMAMLHARYLPTRDLAAAEGYLARAIEGVEALTLPDEEKHFLAVFFSNGLAFVRLRQGRPDDAIVLCRAGVERLNRHLAPHRHRLHRSVLLFNIAQVLAATRAHAEAVEYLGAAIEIDPCYSEYYNERGNALLRLGRFAEALAEYERAIELSPPYAEVRVNRGQCLRQLGRREEALVAFSDALDIEPRNRLARQARAQLADELGQLDEALADYDELLRLDPDQPRVLANRAAVRFAAGCVAESLADLDRAIALAPDDAQLHYNRALAHEHAGDAAAAARDLARCLALTPAAERASIEERLGELEGRTDAA